eukprot:3761967-Pyramimonas_sp.AAC.1
MSSTLHLQKLPRVPITNRKKTSTKSLRGGPGPRVGPCIRSWRGAPHLHSAARARHARRPHLPPAESAAAGRAQRCGDGAGELTVLSWLYRADCAELTVPPDTRPPRAVGSYGDIRLKCGMVIGSLASATPQRIRRACIVFLRPLDRLFTFPFVH